MTTTQTAAEALMGNAAQIQMARLTAARFALDPALVCALCERESAWNPWAVRFEADFERKYIVKVPVLKPTAEELMRAMSFGLMQVMGETARELGFAGAFLTELGNPDVGLEYGCKKLTRCMALAGHAKPALQLYNGGANPNYAREVFALYPKYSGGKTAEEA